MYDQWIKRHQQSAKLSTLHKALIEIMRKDAAEIVESAIKCNIFFQKFPYFDILKRRFSKRPFCNIILCYFAFIFSWT